MNMDVNSQKILANRISKHIMKIMNHNQLQGFNNGQYIYK